MDLLVYSLQRIYLLVNPPLVYPPGFGHHHHHVGDDGLVVEDYDCDGNVDDDLGVTLVYKDTKRNVDFVCDSKIFI